MTQQHRRCRPSSLIDSLFLSFALTFTTSGQTRTRHTYLLNTLPLEQPHFTIIPPMTTDPYCRLKDEENENGEEIVAEVDTRTKLYFGNFPYSVDSAQLVGLIEDYGSAKLVEVLYDMDTGKSRDFAFVTMSFVEDCNAVIKNLDGKKFMG
ncbi:unnamed protein product [Vicia faba]|uniref:RRM domain-containing protein n=1 Tax=Vicia faba TaxID=3906 RepID=A0AAV1AKY8_VICFA|nr:unnamed protein product [Vicia faba]